MGLMIGIELDRPCGELVKRALDAGLRDQRHGRQRDPLLPPLIINEAEARELVVRASLAACSSASSAQKRAAA